MINRTQCEASGLVIMTVNPQYSITRPATLKLHFTMMSSSLETSHVTNLQVPGLALFSSASRASPSPSIIHV